MEKIAFEVDVQNGHIEGFLYPHKEWVAESTQRFDSLSDAVCAAMPLVGKNDDVIISIVTFDPDKPGHTNTEAIYDFLFGKLRHVARKVAQPMDRRIDTKTESYVLVTFENGDDRKISDYKTVLQNMARWRSYGFAFKVERVTEVVTTIREDMV